MDDERAARLLAASEGECGYDHTGGAVLLAAPMASLLIGALLAHLSSRFCPWLPYTPTLALIGILVAYIALEQGECSHMRGSITSWVDINGHALLFLFLPPLLFADTMHMDWELAKTSLLQCMLLAGPGVLLGSGLHMIYGSYMLPYDWDLLLSLGFGAVQAATDPVAVVSLLSSLGAPVTLTMIISGESLLNDGTAIVCRTGLEPEPSRLQMDLPLTRASPALDRWCGTSPSTRTSARARATRSSTRSNSSSAASASGSPSGWPRSSGCRGSTGATGTPTAPSRWR